MAQIARIISEPKKKTGLEKAGDFVGATSLGKRLGGVAYSGTQDYQALGDTLERMRQAEQQTVGLIQKKRAIGADTSKLDALLADTQKQIRQTEQVYNGLPTGGVTNRQVVGSTIQTIASAIPLTGVIGKATQASKIPGLSTKVAPALTRLGTGTATPFKAAAVEGALGGAAFGFGSSLEKGNTVGESIAPALGGAALGALAGPAIVGGLKLFGKAGSKIGMGVEKNAIKGGMNELDKVYTNVLENMNTAFGVPKGLKTETLLKQVTSGPQGVRSNPRVQAVESLYNRAPEIGNVRVYNPKTKTIETKPFDPDNVDFISFFDAKTKSQINIWKQVEDVYKAADDMSFLPKFQKTLDEMNKMASSPNYSAEGTAKMRSFIKDMESKVKTPSDLIAYISQAISPQAGKFFNLADSISAKVAQDSKVKLTELLDNFMSELGEKFEVAKVLREEYSALASLGSEINKKVAEQIPKKAGFTPEDVDIYGASNVVSGAFFGNIAQTGKGAAFIGLKALEKITKSDIKALQRAFKGIDEAYRIAGRERGIKNPVRVGAVDGGLFPAKVSEAQLADDLSLQETIMSFANEIDELPKEVVAQKLSEVTAKAEELTFRVEMLRDAVDSSPYKNKNNRFMVDKEGRTRNVADAKGKLAKKLDDIKAENVGGGVDNNEYVKGYEEYIENRIRLADMEADLKKVEAQAEKLMNKPGLDKNTKGGFSKLATTISTALGVGGVAAVTSPGKMEVAEFDRTDKAPAKLIGNLGIDDLKREIAHRESGTIEGDAAKYSHRGKNKDGTSDLGKYQLNNSSLKIWGPKLLGKPISEQEFLASPKMQEEFFEKMMNRFAKEYRVTDPQMAMALWHKGWGNLTQDRLNRLLAQEGVKKYLANKPSNG